MQTVVSSGGGSWPRSIPANARIDATNTQLEALTDRVERGFADSAHSTEERARALSVLKALRSNLGWVERALRKMDLGTYGPCESCGTAISDERLDALPWAVLCIACKAKGEGR